MAENYSFGIEEEYFIVDADTKAVQRRMPAAFLAALKTGLGAAVTREMLQSQLEVATRPRADIAAAARELGELRRMVSAIAERRGLRIGAAGTHPFALWEEQRIVDRERYHQLVDELQYIIRREVLFGTHIHVAIEGAGRAIYVADGIRRYLPLFLALSCNSPYWRGVATGMMSSTRLRSHSGGA